MNLPAEFVEYTSGVFGEERWKRYVDAFAEEPPVSVRLNPFKVKGLERLPFDDNILCEVPWCRGGYYLKDRPNFTLDPLLHAGAYYVQ